jgi:DNA uptake protein ComE-like DNA-binding protein
MRAPITPLILAGAMLLAIAACNNNQNPQQLRDETARETAALKRDTTAVVEGVKDGLTSKNPDTKIVDINKASHDELTKLPGIDDRRAEKIIAERLYSDKYQLVTRGALTDKEYEKIQDQITLTR